MKPHLLPMHYRLGRELGLSPAEVKRFHYMLAKQAAQQPQPAVIAGEPVTTTLTIISLVASVISTGFAIAASFFKPGTVRPAQLKPREQTGKTISDIRRYAPRDGFDSIQDPATIGAITPMVFAHREQIDGVTYGGVRINMPLLWSCMQCDGNNLLIRAVFLVSEGVIATNGLDPNGFALGSNTLNAYNLGSASGDSAGARYTVYFSRDTGRIVQSDYITGRAASSDPGNAQNFGGPDVFCVKSVGANWSTDFCATSKPSTGAQFGIYSLIGNNIMLRQNPTIKPVVQAQLVPEGDDGDSKVKCNKDEIAVAQRQKDKAKFSTRSGITSFTVGGSPTTDGSNLAIGDTITYVLDKSSDALTDFGRALNAGSWSVVVQVQRIAGTGTTAVNYESGSNTTGVIVDETIPSDSALISGIEWLDATDQIVAQPIVVVTPDPDPNKKKVTLSTRLQYNASGLTDAQKDALLYSRFKLIFKNNFVDNNDEPSALYRAKVKKKIDAGLTVDFTAQTSGYGAVSNTYTINANKRTVSATFNKRDAHSETAADIASTVSGKQQQWDDAIIVGELYKIGSALAVCISKTPDNQVFQSEADFTPVVNGSNGTSIEAAFRVVQAGNAGSAVSLASLQTAANAETQPNRRVATNWPHIFRCSISNFITSRPVRIIEVGIRSTLGIRISGLCNIREALTFSQSDNRACLSYEDDVISSGSTLKPDIPISGTISTSQQRYSFFKISFREAGSSGSYTEFPECFGVKSITQQAIFNSYSIELPQTIPVEIRHVPLSGWEIRQGIATGTLVVLDSRLSSSVTATAGGATLRARGVTVTRSEATFRLQAVSRLATGANKEIGLGYVDEEDYVDAWGKLAESFIYTEISSTNESGPEHEIAFINEIVQNTVTPVYTDLAICGLNVRPKGTFQQLGQFSGYVNAGMEVRRLRNNLTLGSSHLLPDIGIELYTNPIYGSGENVSDDQIDFPGFENAANWCYSRRYFYDAGFIGPKNVTQWMAELAETHLLLFYEINGILTLKPAIPHASDDYSNWNVPIPIAGMFGALQMRNFSFSRFEEEARRPIQVSAKWREERPSSSINNPGIFPAEREILIREASPHGSDDDTIESLDMSDYATSETHVIDACKYKIRFRRLATHTISFDTTQDAVLSPIENGSYIQIPMELSYFDGGMFGIVRGDGTLVSGADISPGQYQAQIWTGNGDQEVQSSSILINEDGTAAPVGIIFAILQTGRELRTYRIENVSPIDQGGFKIEAIDIPITSNGRMELSQNWGSNTTDDYWVIRK